MSRIKPEIAGQGKSHARHVRITNIITSVLVPFENMNGFFRKKTKQNNGTDFFDRHLYTHKTLHVISDFLVQARQYLSAHKPNLVSM